MGDRAAERALGLRALHVDVDPLVVTGRVGEEVHPVLGDLHPVAGAELLALQGRQLGDGGGRGHAGVSSVGTNVARRSGFRTLPVAVLGSSSTNSTYLGTLKAASRLAQPEPQLLGVEVRARRRDDDGHAHLAPSRVGHADHGGLHDLRELQQRGLDLGGVDVLPAGDDHVLVAVTDEEEALVVDRTGVAGAVPAVGQHLGGAFRLVPVAGHHVRPLHDDLAYLVRIGLAAVGAHHPHVGEEDRLAGRPHLPFGVGRVEHRAARGRLGHAVGLLHRHAALEPGAQGRQGERGAGCADGAQGREVAGAESRLAGHRVEHRGDGEERGDPLLLDDGEGLRRVEPAHDHRAAAAQQRRVDRAVEPADVEQRREGERPLVAGEVQPHELVDRVPGHVPVGEHRALRPPGRAGGVHDQAGVLEGDRHVAGLGIGVGEQLLVGQRARAAADRRLRGQPVPDVVQPVAQLVGQRAVVPPVDDDRRTRVPQHVLGLGCRAAGR